MASFVLLAQSIIAGSVLVLFIFTMVTLRILPQGDTYGKIYTCTIYDINFQFYYYKVEIIVKYWRKTNELENSDRKRLTWC